jgi:hypothetical protein
MPKLMMAVEIVVLLHSRSQLLPLMIDKQMLKMTEVVAEEHN